VDRVATALDGIRILDLTRGIAGPLGVLMLAEHGADVIKVEPPGGDPFRAYPAYRCWNRSRRSIAIDLKTEAEAERFLSLAKASDVVVETFRPGVLDRLGVGWDVLHAANPGLVLVSCPGYPPGHRHAARPAYDALVQATSGQMYEQPGWRMGPVFLHMPMPSMAAFSLIAVGTLAALSARERTGRGQHVETSLLQGALLFTTQIWQEVSNGGPTYHDVMAKTYPPGVHQAFIFECAKREFVHISMMSGLTPTKSLDDVIGVFGERHSLDAGRRAQCLTWDAAALVEELRAHNHAAELVAGPADFLDHPQTIANDVVASVDGMRQMGVPIHLTSTPGQVVGPEPAVGSLNAASLMHRNPAPSGVAGGFALDGVRVLDFGQYLAGPFGPMILGDLGADVIKIEPVAGDSMRFAGKPFIGCQRGKRSLALDLKSPAGLDVAHRLIGGADIVHHNMTRGTASKLGIDYPACRALRADIIYCNTYAYGLHDPLGKFGGLDPLYQASAGLEYEAGAVGSGGDPLYLRFGMCDASNAMLSVIGVLLALVHRQRTGEGQELWTSLHDGGVVFASDVWTDSDGVAWDRPHLDAGLHGLTPAYRLYQTQDDGWICVAAVGPGQFEALCEAVGQDLEAGFRRRTARQWHLALDAAGVPNEIPLDSNEGEHVLHDEDNVRLGLVTEYEHSVLGTLRQFGTLISLSDTPGRIAGPPPLVGQHSREILHETGVTDGDIDALISSGVVYEPDPDYRWPN
jgi:crotonobetainyl-CoA:carnitine CoA-transferase CaiB-like acyl-CoA transferase